MVMNERPAPGLSAKKRKTRQLFIVPAHFVGLKISEAHRGRRPAIKAQRRSAALGRFQQSFIGRHVVGTVGETKGEKPNHEFTFPTPLSIAGSAPWLLGLHQV